jgi:hypothetical protein
VVLIVATLAFVLAFQGIWTWFHRIPTQKDLLDRIAAADNLEVIHVRGGKALRFAILRDAGQWRALADGLRFKESYWGFSRQIPDVETQAGRDLEAWVVQGFKGEKQRVFAFEFRDDGGLHIRKAARWYRMSVEPGPFDWVKQSVAEFGREVERGSLPRGEAPMKREEPAGS